MARQHVVAVNAASEAAVVHEINSRYVKTVEAPDGWPLRTVEGVNPAMSACFNEGTLLHETALAPWAKPATSMHINGYHHFPGPAATTPPTPAPVEATTFVPRTGGRSSVASA
jgi:hypothetical protein